MASEAASAPRALELGPARLSECAELAALLARVLPSDSWSAPQLSSEIALPEGRVWRARSGGDLAGFLVARRELDELHILLAGVAPGLRRAGVGKRLLGALLASEGGLASAYLEVREGNLEARSFYGSLGFVEAGRRARHYANGEAAILMTRDLRPRG